MLDGFVYAVPGPMSCHENNSNWRAVPSVERYNPNTNTWVESVRMPIHVNLRHSALVTLDGLIYFIGMEQVHMRLLLQPVEFCVLFCHVILTL